MSVVVQPADAVAGVYAAFGRGDIAGILEFVDEAVEWSYDVQAPGAQSVSMCVAGRGHAGVLHYFRDVAQLEFHEFTPHGTYTDGDVVLVEITIDVSHRSTGKRVRTEEVHRWTVRNGKIAVYRPISDTAAILEVFRP